MTNASYEITYNIENKTTVMKLRIGAEIKIFENTKLFKVTAVLATHAVGFEGVTPPMVAVGAT